MTHQEIRVRIAPSPTGAIHVGLVRSALYNWLFARSHKGKFILRIEDTDATRSTQESVQAIIEGFKWVDIDWDEGPYFQSQRFDIYRNYAKKLLQDKKAYYCYCNPDELEEERQKAWQKKIAWKYDRRCYHLDKDIKDKFDAENRPKAIRFLIPDQTVIFEDIIHGSIKKEPQDIEDFIIMRADGTPTYNFSVVIDDAEMKLTHIIRAVEHLANTPKQILLYQAFGYPIPEFAHLPLILGTDKKKLSKRHGALSLLEYKKAGYLADAIINFLALLGWSPGGDLEIMDRTKLIELFSLERVNKANAIFDIQKLEWMNSVYIKNMDSEKLSQELLPFLQEINIAPDDHARFMKILDLTKVRVRTLIELRDMVSAFYTKDVQYDSDALHKYINPQTKEHLQELNERFDKLTDFTAQNLENELRQLAEQKGIKAAVLVHPCRVALTGKSVGAPLFETIELLGKAKVKERFDKIISQA
ncbi:MAG: glutamate--tRNA ligase [Candidatus Latescibacteria bacterium]|nr:glutamate--tRNA ligase [Candidatus Latescibacterota bacterium]